MTEGSVKTAAASYGRVVHFYDILGDIFSQGAIRRAKRAHIPQLKPGTAVLYVGIGTGSEVSRAVRSGAKLTLVDASPAMLKQLATRLNSERDSQAQTASSQLQTDAPTLIAGDALTLSLGQFDHVILPFFLNVFASDQVSGVLRKMAALVRPGGRLTIVDFRRPRGALGLLARLHRNAPQ